MNKICTSLEQSKKLIELGIDVYTADMCWTIDIPDLPTLLAYPITDCDNLENKIPAWSLAALYSVLPSFTLDSSDDKYFRIHCCKKFSEWHSNPIDTVFEMICWLKENGKL